MSKALVIIKSMGIGDLVILLANIHAISKSINKQVVVLAQVNTQAKAILKNDPYVEEVLDLDKRGIFNIVNKIKRKSFDQVYIYSDSLRFYLISKLSGIKKSFQYKLFSKKGKNFFKTAKKFTEEVLSAQIDHQSQIFWDNHEVQLIRKKFGISSKEKNIVCGISDGGF